MALADCKARRDDRSFLVPEFGVGATRGTTHKAAGGKAAPAGAGPAVIGAPSGSLRPFNTQSFMSRAVRGAARHCCLRVLPDAFDDERIVRRHLAADYCRGPRPAAILAAAPAHDRGPDSVGHHGTWQDPRRVFTGEQCGSASPGRTEYPGWVCRYSSAQLVDSPGQPHRRQRRDRAGIVGLAGTVPARPCDSPGSSSLSPA